MGGVVILADSHLRLRKGTHSLEGIDDGGGFFDGTALSAILAAFSTTAVSEIGDRSFFLATLMALKYGRSTVFLATVAALTIQSIFSSCLGWSLQILAPLVHFTNGKEILKLLVAVLFGFFALSHLRNYLRIWKEERIRTAEDDEYAEGLKRCSSHCSSESSIFLRNAAFRCLSDEEEDNDISNGSGENGAGGVEDRPPPHQRRPLEKSYKFTVDEEKLKFFHCHHNSMTNTQLLGAKRVIGEEFLTSTCSNRSGGGRQPYNQNDPRSKRQIFWKTFVLVFLAEVGDTSMVVSTALATQQSPVYVFIGAALANAVVNGIGIWAGSLGSDFFSEKILNLVACIVFTCLAVASIA